jgi:hypothetical protein
VPHILAAAIPAATVLKLQSAPAGARVATIDGARLAAAGVVRAGTTVLRVELTPDATDETVARLREQIAPGAG